MGRMKISLQQAFRRSNRFSLGTVPKQSHKYNGEKSPKPPRKFVSKSRVVPEEESKKAHALIERVIAEGGVKRANEKELIRIFVADFIEKKSPAGIAALRPRLGNLRVPLAAKEIINAVMFARYKELGGK